MWRNDNLSNPSAGDMYTPARDPDGELTRSPHWSHPGPPTLVTDITAFLFATEVAEVKRFRVAIACKQFNFKLTDASSRKLKAAMEEAGEDAFYEVDYATQEAVILKVTKWEQGWEDT